MAKPRPTKIAIEAAVKRVEDALSEHGILLEHDAALPSATALIAGKPIQGSWWGHAQGALIYEALTALENDVVLAKLVNGKETLLHRRLWPALVSIGQSRDAWQLDGLSEKALEVLKRSDGGEPLRADALSELGTTKAVREIFRELELRLLAHSRSIHTDRGRHVRVLTSWRAFQAENGIRASDLGDPATAKDQLWVAFASWATSETGAFPWVVRPRRR